MSILELRHIDKTYLQGKLEVPVLRDVSLSVEEGDYLAIIGPSGSGKSTLMNIIGCLDVPTAGEYLLEGNSLAGSSDAVLSQTRLNSIGFVFQSFYLLPRQSALENVALPLLYAGVGKKKRLEMAKTALERVGLGERLEFKPTQLSGGQCQRVAIARAMVNDPKILLADEPTGALDTASGDQVMDLFEKLNREGVTIVMITHEPSVAARARRVLHIRDGRLVDVPRPVAPKPVSIPTVIPVTLIPTPAPSPVAEPTPEEIAAFADENYQPEPQPVEASPQETAAPEKKPVPAEEPVSLSAPAPQAAPSLAAPVSVRRQEHRPLQPAFPSREAPVLEIEDIPIEGPEAPDAFAKALHSMAAEPIVLPPLEQEPAPSQETAPQPADTLRPAQVEESLEDDLAQLLDREVSALIDRGEATSAAYASGDLFLRDATAKPAQLVERPTKAGAPDQMTFDVWQEPEELDVEAIDSLVELVPEPEEAPETAPGDFPRTKPAGIEAEESAAPEDGLFDRVQQDIDAVLSGDGAPPRKIALDLGTLFAPKETPGPWGEAAPGGKNRLVELPDLLGKPNAKGGEAP